MVWWCILKYSYNLSTWQAEAGGPLGVKVKLGYIVNFRSSGSLERDQLNSSPLKKKKSSYCSRQRRQQGQRLCGQEQEREETERLGMLRRKGKVGKRRKEGPPVPRRRIGGAFSPLLLSLILSLYNPHQILPVQLGMCWRLWMGHRGGNEAGVRYLVGKTMNP